MKKISMIRNEVMRQGERSYCRGFSQAVFFASQRLTTSGNVTQFIKDGIAEDWSRRIDPVTGQLVVDYFPVRLMADAYLVEIRKRKGLESEISKLWEKRYRDGFHDGWKAFRCGDVDLYEAYLYRYQASGRKYGNHKDPITRESMGLRTATLRAMNEMRDIDNLRQLF